MTALLIKTSMPKILQVFLKASELNIDTFHVEMQILVFFAHQICVGRYHAKHLSKLKVLPCVEKWTEIMINERQWLVFKKKQVRFSRKIRPIPFSGLIGTWIKISSDIFQERVSWKNVL